MLTEVIYHHQIALGWSEYHNFIVIEVLNQDRKLEKIYNLKLIHNTQLFTEKSFVTQILLISYMNFTKLNSSCE